jgi:hypothetical protein
MCNNLKNSPAEFFFFVWKHGGNYYAVKWENNAKFQKFEKYVQTDLNKEKGILQNLMLWNQCYEVNIVYCFMRVRTTVIGSAEYLSNYKQTVECKCQ